MSLQSGRGTTMRFQEQPLAPTCYIQSLITGECASRPTAFEPSLRGLAPSANNAYIVPGGICGLNTSNAHIPCGGGAYCSDVYVGYCTNQNAIGNPDVRLEYVNYGSRL
jgi:hypothetical protein